eukprot:14709649-Alexandrium_andersonii.AAC.1
MIVLATRMYRIRSVGEGLGTRLEHVDVWSTAKNVCRHAWMCARWPASPSFHWHAVRARAI